MDHPMSGPVWSRRTFLKAAGLGATALWCASAAACASSTTADVAAPSPLASGPYTPGTLIMGESAIPGMPQPFELGLFDIPAGAYAGFPRNVKAAVYYPSVRSTSKELHIAHGPFPLLLYAHAFRGELFSMAGSHDADRDFTSIAAMLQHVTTYGCVCVVPDLSWLTDEWGTNSAFDERSVVLVNYYTYLTTLTTSVFLGQLDLSRVILAGHSTGAGGAVSAGRIIGDFSHPRSLSYGLIAPQSGGGTDADIHDLLVVGGTLDTDQGAEPQGGYTNARSPKTWVTIPGANHFGYTDICPADNACAPILNDENGTITRQAQQMTAAAYLAALVRYYARGDATARPYLSGAQAVEGLEDLGVSDVQVEAQGFLSILPHPTIVPPNS